MQAYQALKGRYTPEEYNVSCYMTCAAQSVLSL